MTEALWWFLPIGYVLTVTLELPVLWVGLSPAHPWRRRIGAGLWLTACTYPVVVLVLPPLLYPFGSRVLYLAVAETFAPLAECLLFFAAFDGGHDTAGYSRRRDALTIIAANLLSFLVGEGLIRLGWL